MKLQSGLIAALFAVGSLASSVPAMASSISVGTDYYMTVSQYPSGEELNGHGYYVGYTTITIFADNGGVKGTELAQYNDAYCIDYFNDIQAGATYIVEAQGVGATYNAADNPNPGTVYNTNDPTPGPMSDAKLEADAVLGKEFDGNDANDSVIQETIWDEGGAEFHLNSSQLANAVNAQNEGSVLGVTGDIAFLEVNGDGQSFMVDLPVAGVPEPSSLLMLGTGLAAAAGTLRRRLKNS
jgi:hypothetical protein